MSGALWVAVQLSMLRGFSEGPSVTTTTGLYLLLNTIRTHLAWSNNTRAELSGVNDSSWNWDDLQPYFRKVYSQITEP